MKFITPLLLLLISLSVYGGDCNCSCDPKPTATPEVKKEVKVVEEKPKESKPKTLEERMIYALKHHKPLTLKCKY